MSSSISASYETLVIFGAYQKSNSSRNVLPKLQTHVLPVTLIER